MTAPSANEVVDSLVEAISPLVDSTNSEQIDILNYISSATDLSEKIEQFRKLFQKVTGDLAASSADRESKLRTNMTRILSHLSGLVSLLQAISTNPELASLFLVGDSGLTSFTSIQRSLIEEQAARTRLFINGFSKSIQLNPLSDPSNYLSSISTLPDKMEALSRLKESVTTSDDSFYLRSAFSEACSILESSLLFNDLLIQSRPQIESLMEIFPGSPREPKKFKEWLKSFAKGMEKKGGGEEPVSAELRASRQLIKELKEKLAKNVPLEGISSQTALSEKASSCCEELRFQLKRSEEENEKLRQRVERLAEAQEKSYREIKENEDSLMEEKEAASSENKQLREQNQQLQQQIKGIQDTLAKREEKIEALSIKNRNNDSMAEQMRKSKKADQSENSRLQQLYQAASARNNELTMSNDELQLQLSKVHQQIETCAKDNGELRRLLAESKETIKKQTDENSILLKQMKRRDGSAPSEDLQKKVKKLSEKLKVAYAFIEKLQREIAHFKKERSRESSLLNDEGDDEVPERFSESEGSRVTESCKDESTCCRAFQPKLDDLDFEIRRLEKNVKKSKRVLGIPPSSSSSSFQSAE